jgi:succinyl-diaminopimelate desuccinylase
MNANDAFPRVARRLERFRDDMVDLQLKLCAIPAVAPSSGGEGEARKAEFLKGYLQENGFSDITVIKAPDLDAADGYRPNIIARVKGRSSDRTVWVMTHMDVVPPGEISLWKGHPFQAWVEHGRVYGRGTEDNQQDLVASIFAARALAAEDLEPACDIGLVIVADEETGSLKGIDYVLKTHNVFRERDIIIVPDAGNENGTMIEVAEKSILWLKFRTLGKQAHGSTPEKGVNSFRAASRLVAALDRLYRLFPARDSLFSPPISTFEPTKKEANVPNINTIPGEDVFYMDCRVLPRYPLPEVEKRIRMLAAEVEKKFHVRIKMEAEQRAPAAPPTPADAPVVRTLKKAVKEVYGKNAKPMGIGGGTVAAVFRRAGFQAACWSKLDDTAHLPNEYCVIDNMVGNAKVYAHIFLDG